MITTLKQTTYPITEVAFPAVTICGSGFHMENVKTALQRNFASWRKELGKRNVSLIAQDFAEYMEVKFQISPKKSYGGKHPPNILDMLDTMIASDVEASVAANGVRQNALACSQAGQAMSRGKRNVAAELASSINEYNCEEYGYYSDDWGSESDNSKMTSAVDDWTDCVRHCLESDTCQYWQWKTPAAKNHAKRCVLFKELLTRKSDSITKKWNIPKVVNIQGPRSCKKEATLLSTGFFKTRPKTAYQHRAFKKMIIFCYIFRH